MCDDDHNRQIMFFGALILLSNVCKRPQKSFVDGR